MICSGPIATIPRPASSTRPSSTCPPIRRLLLPVARGGAADAAQAHSFFSHLDTNIQRILAGFGTLRDLVTDVRASLADAAARDAQRAEDEEARDKAIEPVWSILRFWRPVRRLERVTGPQMALPGQERPCGVGSMLTRPRTPP